MTYRSDDDGAGAAIRRELLPGESLVWHGRPRVGGFARKQLQISTLGVPFLAVGFILLQAYLPSVPRVPPFIEALKMPAVGLIFFLVGCVMVVSGPWAMLRARRMAYGITDGRLMILERTLFRLHVRSYSVGGINTLERRAGRRRTGDVLFRRDVNPNHEDPGPVLAGFIAVDDAWTVESEVLRLLARYGRARP